MPNKNTHNVLYEPQLLSNSELPKSFGENKDASTRKQPIPHKRKGKLLSPTVHRNTKRSRRVNAQKQTDFAKQIGTSNSPQILYHQESSFSILIEAPINTKLPCYLTNPKQTNQKSTVLKTQIHKSKP